MRRCMVLAVRKAVALAIVMAVVVEKTIERHVLAFLAQRSSGNALSGSPVDSPSGMRGSSGEEKGGVLRLQKGVGRYVGPIQHAVLPLRGTADLTAGAHSAWPGHGLIDGLVGR